MSDCRCKACTEPPEHGLAGYQEYDCRCPTCKAANTAAHLRWSNRVKASLPAPRKGALWTDPELEIIARDDLSVAEMARLCGRTYAATAEARRKFRQDFSET